MIVKLLTEQHKEFLSLKGGCTGSSESILSKMFIVVNHMSRLYYVNVTSTKISYGGPYTWIFYLF